MCSRHVRSNWDKLKSVLLVTGYGTSVFVGYSLYTGSEQFYDNVAMPLVKLLDPELSHKIAVWAVKYGLVAKRSEDFENLHTSLLGLNFKNSIGMAAGFDKHAEIADGLLKMGFGFVEIGSVTPVPQPGNPKPRVFRLLEDKAVINRYGFNSDGHDVVYERLVRIKSDPEFSGIIGVNLGKNKTSIDSVQDYVSGILKFSDVADYFVINVSSPNTPGLRDLQSKNHLQELLLAINKARSTTLRKPPLLLKLAPDLTPEQQQEVAQVIQSSKSSVDGLVLTNTTISRDNLTNENKFETGGLSGAPLTHPSTKMIANMYKLTNGKIPIIGVGGVFDGRDAYEKIKSGASLVQIYTSYIYHGPPVVGKIKRELSELLEKDGFDSVSKAVGKEVNLKQASKWW